MLFYKNNNEEINPFYCLWRAVRNFLLPSYTKYARNTGQTGKPVMYEDTFSLTEVGDTFFDMENRAYSQPDRTDLIHSVGFFYERILQDNCRSICRRFTSFN